jgi:hypothetical protein
MCKLSTGTGWNVMCKLSTGIGWNVMCKNLSCKTHLNFLLVHHSSVLILMGRLL